MINTQEIEHLTKLCIYSAFIEGERPVSLLIVAPVEHGKSEILKKFAFIETIKISTDFNSFIFGDFVIEYQSAGKRTLVIPDFLRIVKKKYSTQCNSLTIFNSLIEEGWVGKLPSGSIIQNPITANILTAITQDEMIDKRHKWSQIGFLSRFIPVSFLYKDDTKTQIRNYIKDRIYRSDDFYDFKLPKTKMKITLPKDLADKLEKISLNISLKNNLTGFRLQRQIQVLAMSNALVNNRDLVMQSDVDTIDSLSKYINFDFTKI